MSDQLLHTPHGDILFRATSEEAFERLARTWPNGIFPLPDGAPAPFGIPFQKGEVKVSGVKLQGPDSPKDGAELQLRIHQITLAGSLCEYLAAGFSGVLIPCAYLKPKGNERFETGMAFFAAPAPGGKELEVAPKLPHIDDELGAGTCNMVFTMTPCVPKCAERLHLPKPTVIGVDVRPRLQMGSVQLDFLVSGPDLFCLKKSAHPDDPIWKVLIESSVKEGFSLPSLPIAI